MAKIGRPSMYSDELAHDICCMVAAGEDVKSVCVHFGIGLSTLHDWREKFPGFSESYMRARALSGEASEARIQAIMDEARTGKIDANTARVLLDGEKWLAAKRAPRTHGDRVEVEHSGSVAGGLGPVVIQITAHQPAVQAIDVAPVPLCQITSTAGK